MSGETSGLFDELTGAEKYHGPYRKVHYRPDGSIHWIQNAGMDDEPKPEVQLNFHATYPYSGPMHVTCARCNELYNFNEPHVCPDGMNHVAAGSSVSTNADFGYTCVFCNSWIPYGNIHTCLFDKKNDYQLIMDKLVLLELKLDRISRHLGMPNWKFGTVEEFLDDIMGKENE